MSQTQSAITRLDPVTFEVLKNAFVNLVDQMSEQILRTCYSFVIYSRDFSSAICDAEGNTIMQGTQDISVHVGTLHLTAKAVLEDFGDDIHPGDVFLINDPYRGGTHFCDVRVVRPVFYDGKLISFMQSNGHWADVGGNVPGSFNVRSKDHYGEGMRIPPVRIWSKGQYLQDVANLLVANMRVPEERLGDLRAQAEATKVGEMQLVRLIEKYGLDTVLIAFEEVQNYVERLGRARISELPNGTWETTDYIDMDPEVGDQLIPIHVRMTIKDDEIDYDLTGSHPYISCFLNAGFGASFSAVISGTKTFFPDIPLNSGFYRFIHVNLPEDSVVNAPWPVAVTGFCSGAYEKIMNAIFELWSGIMPERALACSFNLEYLLIGGWDRRAGYDNYFMWYDWMAGGHGGRSYKDGANAMSPVFGVGLSIQPCEGQERLSPVITTHHEIVTDSAGPGKFRGGCGVRKGGILTSCENTVMSYCCDRSRSVTWGIQGGLPSLPHGVRLNPGSDNERFLGTVFSSVALKPGDSFDRPSAGGGGLGDPLERDPKLVLEDVIDQYVSIERARKDYGVIIKEIDREIDLFEIDEEATKNERAYIRAKRRQWLQEDIASVEEKFKRGEIDELDVIRRYGVIMDYTTGHVLPNSTAQYRDMLYKRTLAHWE
ncbi:hydantoinase B/oxoprolinase family protein [Aneurinibacillus thermoaerophilus]|uniref:Hydantoinase B/oxoprolinase family protein n=1 Tax=Aneurinibacillus thermoaerophilus TaxID=143495 RepID=A0A1G7YVD6_ANETH|nr:MULTISPECIES: hydantoinase B/oxoprolinase family protein [Aneurinibacillus]AMA73184.1 methylhydantoinase [Aneurinibacillus sp. XH2]MED0674392.1 hydantoinase B/oxoprolinase family protein [Aneurinibacillus thermoaerophilus]MED0678411.1 hydantoinase B/oxoprolinase family protein [Aneurinibacillus thermoaerophilus]MED0758697.1 hydantoinase B/oxoprolinase family protein [Aneurinibacillus thermoaerophilus]MED0760992.1 hydantoinase B/oxoprolinase family protein [Aneurinibacillus thermoaerophilus]